MNTIFVVIGLAAAGAIVAFVTALRRGDHTADLGAVSHQWIAEHRLSSGEDSRR